MSDIGKIIPRRMLCLILFDPPFKLCPATPMHDCPDSPNPGFGIQNPDPLSLSLPRTAGPQSFIYGSALSIGSFFILFFFHRIPCFFSQCEYFVLIDGHTLDFGTRLAVPLLV